jgi:hypothetical protein
VDRGGALEKHGASFLGDCLQGRNGRQ